MKTNYNEIMKDMINNLDYIPKLLLHSCCGPCSTAVISRLTDYFDITVLYYNPNIEPEAEYYKRKNEQIKFLNNYKGTNSITFLDCDYDNEAFLKIAKGLENEPEGGLRCHACYKLRLEKTVQIAKEKGYNYFGTTLTVSPYKNAQIINPIGKLLEEKYQVKFLYADFKKEEGYKKSIEMAKEYDLYRQNYCGCHFSQQLDINE